MHRWLRWVFLVGVLALIPAGVAAQDSDNPDDSSTIRIGGDITISDNERIGTLISINGNAVIDGRVDNILWGISSDVTVNGTVDGDIVMLWGSLTLADGAVVNGDIDLGDTVYTPAPGATVNGTLEDNAFSLLTDWKSRGTHARIWTSLTLLCLVVAVVLARIGGDQIDKVGNSVIRRPLITLGTGCLASIVLPLAGLLMLTSIFVLPMGALLLVLVPGLWLTGYIVTGIMLGRLLLTRSDDLLRSEAYNPYAAAIVGILLIQLLVLIPLGDMLIIFVAIVVGTGALLVTAFTTSEPLAPAGASATHAASPSPELPQGRRRIVTRVLVLWLVNALALLLIAGLTPTLNFSSSSAALGLAAMVGLFNAVIRPLILRVTLPLTVLTLGLFVLFIDAMLLQFAERIMPGVEVESFWAAFGTAILLSLINLLVGGVLAVGDDNSFYRYSMRRFANRERRPDADLKGTMLIVEIDGLSHPVLMQAMAGGYAPNLARWVDEGSHILEEFDCGLPAQTSACQAGILYGDNFDIPAFRWYEKENSTLMVSNNPRQASEIDRRLRERSDGLLHQDGVSIGNLVSGGAAEAPLTMSAVTTSPRAMAREQSSLYFYFLGPYNFMRTIALMINEIVIERWEAFQQRRSDVQPRMHRNWSYVLERIVSTILIRDLETAIVLRDIYAGVPVSYAMYVGYDVVAHHAGPASPDALKVLEKIDRRIGMLERAATDATQPVHFVVLSDHGQSWGATFLQQYGETVEDIVNRLTDPELQVSGANAGEHEGFNQFNAMLSGLIAGETGQSRTARRILQQQTSDGYVDITPKPEKEPDPDEESRILVLASGNLGLVYLKDLPGRATLEMIEATYPGLIEGLVTHEGIGFMMVATQDRGPVIIGPRGLYLLETDTVEGELNPLEHYGPRAADHYRRLDSFPNCGDIMLNSTLNTATNEVPAFEELIGSHGGLGGPQTQPFLLYPTEWTPSEKNIHTANEIYTVLEDWRRDLHVDADEPEEQAAD